MMFLDPGDGSGDLLAISQPAHAWVSGQLLRQWAVPLEQPVLLAAEQHDLAWIDWERAPTFDPATRRPHLFRDVGAAAHAPRWIQAVARAHAAWGAHVALLISRHGSVIYTRFTDRHRAGDADDRAAADYLARQGEVQADWAQQLGLARATLEHETNLIAFVDTLSLALCGALEPPLEIHGPTPEAGTTRYRLTPGPNAVRLTPWPFQGTALHVSLAARRLGTARLRNEDDMHTWLTSTMQEPLTRRLEPAPLG